MMREPAYSSAVREMPEEDRPRERLARLGPEALRDAELLAVLFRTGTREMGAVALAEQVVRPRLGVLELQGAMVLLPVLPDRLEEDQRIPAAVAQFVLGQVGRDRVDPRRELLPLVEAVQVPVHADECLLH